LTARIAAIRLRHREGQFINRELSVYVGKRFRVADSREDVSRFGHACVKRAASFVDQATSDLAAAPLIEAAVDDREVRGQPDAQWLPS
jgi:hypothetical protein